MNDITIVCRYTIAELAALYDEIPMTQSLFESILFKSCEEVYDIDTYNRLWKNHPQFAGKFNDKIELFLKSLDLDDFDY